LHFEGGVRGSGQWALLRFFDTLLLGLFLIFFPTALLAFNLFFDYNSAFSGSSSHACPLAFLFVWPSSPLPPKKAEC
jgi:hypothetical protein